LYDKLAQLYLAKYGYRLDWDDDLEDGQNIADDVDPDEDVDGLSTEEVEFCSEYFKKLRGVC
jgi:hypothetical protein